jgi:peptidoglycan-associated lipoprotein
MNRKLLNLTLMASALSMTAACGSRRPPNLPPVPPSADGSQDPSSTDPNGGIADPNAVGTTGLSGARAAFVQAAGSDRVFFALDSYSIDAEARTILDAQARWLVANPGINVTIEGHADERGTREYNLALGERRANAAKNYLAARGVAESRMSVISWGMERPEVEGSNEAAWAQNRRAVTVLPQ